MMRRTTWLAVGLAALLGAHAAAARPKPKARSAAAPRVAFSQYQLDNGLRVILAPDHSAPVIAISVTYDVGSRNERPGRTGFAHLFEHMMFQGSENVGRGEHPMLVGDNGGSMNGTTNQDRTNYFETLPANQLDLAVFLEADRMRALDVTPENLANQRAVVQEEKRQSYDNRPYGHVYETMLELAYSDFAYKHSTIGSMADLDQATLDDVRQFFRTYYAPNNAVVALAGDFDVKTAKQTVERYFGPIPRQPAPSPVQIHEPEGTGERRRVLNDRLARLPQYVEAYRTVPGDHPDYFALSMLARVLAGGRASRLYPAVVEKNLALSADASQIESRGPGLFTVDADLPPGASVEPAEAAIRAEIARVQADGVTEEELTRAKTQARLSAVSRLETALGRANTLSHDAVYYHDPERINPLLPRLLAVTPADVQRVARTYLTTNNRTVVITMPAAGAPAPRPENRP
jgi:zinc protease